MTSSRGLHVDSYGHTSGQLPLARTTVDRLADRRHDEEWLSAAWADPRTRVLVVERGRAQVDAANRLVLRSPEQAPEGERYFLGVESGQAYFAVSVASGTLETLLPDTAFAAPGAAPAGASDVRAVNLRDVGALLDDRDAGLLVHAVALQRWHREHGYCPRCGAATVAGGAGHVRVCAEDGSEHYPRVDPAVIMLIRDEEDRCLLARKPSWPQHRYSVLAGFVEPGESLEQAVAREVSEEVGLYVAAARYIASQPWPFPSSLMLGFMATASGGEVTVDQEEIVEAYWYTRTQLERATERGNVLLPPDTSIARRLIEGWYGGRLPRA